MKKLTLLFASSSGFSGQRFASELLVRGLGARGWRTRIINTPALEREVPPGQKRPGLAAMLWRLIAAWARGLRAAFDPAWLYVNLGLTRFACLRDGLPLIVAGILRPRARACVSLHGNVFMDWSRDRFESRVLRLLGRTISFITVVGPHQRDKLIALGLPRRKVTIMDNTCLLPPSSEAQIREKHAEGGRTTALFLSALIESKGYAEFVEAVERAAARNVPLDAILCGRVVIGDDSRRFPTHESARTWIEGRRAAINASRETRLTWVEGAVGAEKEALFRRAHIFVLPSRYRIESQPIVLIEAMASGAALVTTDVGEIPSMVGPDAAVLLERPTPEALCEAIVALQSDAPRRHAMALRGRRLFLERYAFERHIDRWERLLSATEAP